MVARILTGKSIRGLLQYNESKVQLGNAALILANRFGLDIEYLEMRHKVARFEHLTKLNSRVKTNAVHIMLNFDQSDEIDLEKLQMIAAKYMDQIGLGEQPFLVYKHEDASHPHLHIVTTNIKSDANRIDLHNIGKTLSEEARKAIEQEYQLIQAEGRGNMQPIIPSRIDVAAYGEKPTKCSIYNVVTAVLRDYKFTSFPEFNAALNAFNVAAYRGTKDSLMFEKGGLVYSIVDQNGKRIGIPFKASALAGKPTLKVIERKFETNKIKRKIHAELLKNKISQVLKENGKFTKKRLIKALSKKGIILLFRQNENGPIYGVTYVDHSSRCVFNGSDLGKEFSAKALLENVHSGGQSVNIVPNSAFSSSGSSLDISLNPLSSGGQPEQKNNTGLLDTLLQESLVSQSPLPGKVIKRKRKGKSKKYDLGNKI